MSFLSYIDERYEQVKGEFDISRDNKSFNHYEAIKPLDFMTNTEFLLKKNALSKILFCPSGTRINLSDEDIIYNILYNMPEFYCKRFLSAFLKIYGADFSDFGFKISECEFHGKGICYFESTIGNVEFLLHTDNRITYNEFIFILNIVFEKDRLTTSDPEKDYLKNTLHKYIALILYYKYQDINATRYLSEINFPIGGGHFQRKNDPKSAKKVKKLFWDNALFKKIILLD